MKQPTTRSRAPPLLHVSQFILATYLWPSSQLPSACSCLNPVPQSADPNWYYSHALLFYIIANGWINCEVHRAWGREDTRWQIYCGTTYRTHTFIGGVCCLSPVFHRLLRQEYLWCQSVLPPPLPSSIVFAVALIPLQCLPVGTTNRKTTPHPFSTDTHSFLLV